MNDSQEERLLKIAETNPELAKEMMDFILGFHRLSINGIDEISNQPLEIDDIILICNGEIYNFQELKKKYALKTKTSSDTEILLQLYIKLKDKILNELL